uniref:Coiled-coil domain containing 183 n=1 Tax=Latimeria chalumnae TaxID=7897 RepID=M3XL50_LATCH
MLYQKVKKFKDLQAFDLKYRDKGDIQEQIKELRAKIALLEQERKAYYQFSQEVICQNAKTIHLFEKENRVKLLALKQAEKQDQIVIAQACKGRKATRLALLRCSAEDAKVKLEKPYHNNVNVHNVLCYEIKKKKKMLEDLKSMLTLLEQLDNPKKHEYERLQRLRQLENNIEKMETKTVAAQNIQNTYLKLLDYMQGDLVHVPFFLDDFEENVRFQRCELRKLTKIGESAAEAKRVATMELNELERRFIEQRQERESMLAEKRKLAYTEKLRYKDSSDKQSHKQDASRKQAGSEFSTSMVSQMSGSGLKSDASKIPNEVRRALIADLENLKHVADCSKLQDISRQFVAQEVVKEHLQQLIAENENNQKALKSSLKELELVHANVKFHQGRGFQSYEKMKKELEDFFTDENKRRVQVKTRLDCTKDVLQDVEDGIDNLFMKLYGITVPEEPQHFKPSDICDKLHVCVEKVFYLVQQLDSLMISHLTKEDRFKVCLFVF